MPTDEVGLDSPSQDPEESGSEEQAPSAPPPPGPTGEQIAEVIREAAASGNQPVLEAVAQLQQLLAQQAQERQGPAPEPTELADRLLTDPKAVLGETMNEWGRSQLAPILSRHYEVDRDERIEARAAEVDERFGDGYFDEHIRPRLVGEHGNLRAYPINQQADPLVIDSAIRGILGNMLMDQEQGPKIEEAMAKVAKQRSERAVRTPPNLMGPGRAGGSRSAVLTPELKEALSKFQEVGVRMSEKDLKDALGRGPHLSEWLPKEDAR